MTEKKKVSLEENFEQIEELLTSLEAEETSLEESFRYYQEGMKLLKSCNAIIDTVEKKVLKLKDNGETDEL